MAGDESFRPEARLRRAEDYAAVFSARRVLRSGTFDLHVLRREAGAARLGLVVPKKIARLAVLRNTVKRMAREIFRRRRSELPPSDLVLRLARKPGSGAFDRPAIRRDIEALLEKLLVQP